VKELLNDLFDEPLPMTKGTVRQGILLGVGDEKLPDHVRSFDVSLEFVDSLDRQATANIRVWREAPMGVAKSTVRMEAAGIRASQTQNEGGEERPDVGHSAESSPRRIQNSNSWPATECLKFMLS
jgi:hypothetical protein